MDRQIVITGLGAICALGKDPGAILDALYAGRSAIGPMMEWASADTPPPLAACIPDLAPRELVSDRKLHKLIRRTDLLGLYAAERAIAAAGIAATRETLEAAAIEAFNDRTGIYDASGGGNYQDSYEFFPLMSSARGELRVYGEELTSQVDPMFLLKSLPNNVLCHLGIRQGFKGPNCCFVNQSSSGPLVIGQALDTLRDGEADRVVVVAHDAPVEPQSIVYYSSLGLLSLTSLRPFDERHDGTVLGEGAAAMMLETRESAAGRDAPVLGEVLSVACTSEAGGLLPLRRDGDGLARAIEAALDSARLERSEIGAIVAHGNGTPASDDSEAAAIKRVFGSSVPPVTSFKWGIGHLLAGAGMIEAVLALKSLAHGTVPGIATFESPAAASAGLPVSRDAQTPRSPIGLVLCRGFGSFSTALIVRAGGSSR